MTPARSTIVIALAFDSQYVAPAAAALRSCLDHRGPASLRFHVLHDRSLGPSNRYKLDSMCDQDGVTCRYHLFDPDVLGGLPGVDRFGPIVWARLFLPELLEDTARALYLDSDTLVLSSLDPLWREDLAGCPVGAVANVVEPAAREHIRELGISYPGGFFNSGVLLLDLARMRAEGSVDELVRYARSHWDELQWPDQDTLNTVLKDHWHRIHPRWNAQNSFWSWREWAVEVFGERQWAEATRDPGIRHFEGPSLAKPWHYLCLAPHRDAYLETQARTPWAGEPIQEKTASTVMISWLPRRWRVRAYVKVLAARETWRQARS